MRSIWKPAGEALKSSKTTEVADAYVINSCTVTSAADRDARSHAGKYKRQNPAALVGIVGCYAQVAREEILSLPEVDFCVGTANKFRVLDHFNQTWEQRQQGQQLGIARDQVESPRGFLPTDFPGSRNARASIKIQDGCNFHCSFCIIPDARGRSRSLPLEAVLKQVDEAHAQGFNEIVLTGIHLAHYGWDQGTDLMKLLQRIFEKPEGPRVRLSTLDPFEIPDELIALLGQEKRLCPHFHIAIQSGSDKVLAGMRRIYKAREFYDVSAKIEKQCPDTFIGMDVIVGFPGEGEAEFQETLDCLKNTFWSKLHVFPFSVRKGTRAEQLDGKVRDYDIFERSRILRELSDAEISYISGRPGGKEEECFAWTSFNSLSWRLARAHGELSSYSDPDFRRRGEKNFPRLHREMRRGQGLDNADIKKRPVPYSEYRALNTI